MTDQAGQYIYWLDESGSPYTVTASAAEHSSVVQSGVIITGQQTTWLDFNLRWQVSCLRTNPPSLAVTLALGDHATLPLTLTNSGAGVANFELKDEDRGDQDDRVSEQAREPVHYACSSRIPSTMFATSSQRSVASSMVS